MSCPYRECAVNSSHGTCRHDKSPETCTYGRQQKELDAAYQKGFRAGLAHAANQIGSLEGLAGIQG